MSLCFIVQKEPNWGFPQWGLLSLTYPPRMLPLIHTPAKKPERPDRNPPDSNHRENLFRAQFRSSSILPLFYKDKKEILRYKLVLYILSLK